MMCFQVLFFSMINTYILRWSTHWFELQVNIPTDWKGQEIHLLWNSGSEALVWVNGEPQQVN